MSVLFWLLCGLMPRWTIQARFIYCNIELLLYFDSVCRNKHTLFDMLTTYGNYRHI